MEKVIYLADAQSFYASVEKAENPVLADKPVVVSGDPKRRSGIILAACPLAKSYGIETAEPLWQALQKCPHAVVIQPRMKHYINVSIHMTQIYETFTDLVEPYSIDEQFLDVTGSLHLFGSPIETAKKIQKKMIEETGIYIRIGIGPTKVLAKMATDNFAKKNESGIFQFTRENIEKDLWTLPIEKMFMVGRRMTRNLKSMGIRTIGQLANFPVSKLEKRWGINGTLLHMIANGIDYSPVHPDTHASQKAVGHHMTLPRDYFKEEDIKVVLLELCEEVSHRARQHGVTGQTVAVGCRGADWDFPTGFYRQQKIEEPTNHTIDIFRAAWNLFIKHWDGEAIRSIGVNLSRLTEDNVLQLSLFEDKVKKRAIGYAMDEIKNRFGPTAIIRASSLLDSSQAHERAKKIGGHYK